MGKLSTHVLDISAGKPGAGVKVALYAVGPDGRALLKPTSPTPTAAAPPRCWRATP